ncbi:hypothetical protein SAMN00017405_0652 [Desulfonispora thiosulfatigenes DSM 11270]|uniref:Uncharacterized protein n=1 Tax=Desulfonispora thiosulfatigenes DSM 11270 TaxID=656914 RepID=A0A1W1V8Y4_DESTI|nr:hypothetical protein SAMN00017405_0652 [Desulfonispora thiosulfatigenes DSM 11270]
MEIMLGLVYGATAVTYVSVGVLVYGWLKHNKNKQSVR